MEGKHDDEREFTIDVGGDRIACRQRDGDAPGFVWLGGLRSDMDGSKAETMVDYARELGRASLRFDYSGHGRSSGDFRDGTISRWLHDAEAAFALTQGPQILVGSSMGAWIALRLTQNMRAQDRQSRIAALVLIAPAPDFTSELMEPGFTSAQRESLARDGFFEEPSEYSDEPMIYTRALIDDGRANRVLTDTLRIDAPVHIIQGMKDPDVPYSHALRLAEHLVDDDVTMTLVRDGDHRLSRDRDLALLRRTLAQMSDG